ncbi:hypothetical protein ABT095_14530 [Kitasatospora sp. NPDC002227]|uniref:hypothetical protein n=1 Tax=Kitasatospora sp. NPDC002227 TaxID=3154773 RepID=UPI003326B6C7
MADLSKQPEARPVFDPAVPAQTQHALVHVADACPELLADADETGRLGLRSRTNGKLLRRSLGTAAGGGALALGIWIFKACGGLGEDIDMGTYEPFDKFMRNAVDAGLAMGLILFIAGAAFAALQVFLDTGHDAEINHHIDQARGRYVHPSWLSNDAALLLGRAQHAADTIFASRLQQDDLGGLGAANQIRLSQLLWDLADSLHRYSRTAQAAAAAVADSLEVDQLLAAEREVLDAVLAGAKEQVEALEDYAARAQEVDRLAADQAVAEGIEARSAEVRDLVAGTAAARIGVEGITSLSASAAVVSEALADALQAAQDAAATVLPTRSDTNRQLP